MSVWLTQTAQRLAQRLPLLMPVVARLQGCCMGVAYPACAACKRDQQQDTDPQLGPPPSPGVLPSPDRGRGTKTVSFRLADVATGGLR